MSIQQFYELASWETGTDEHHVFPGKLINGAYQKKGLSKKQLAEIHRINLEETKRVLISAHHFYNRLFKNSSPPTTLEKLSELMSGNYLLYPAQKKIFIKFCLCVAKEKLRGNFGGLEEIVKSVDIDINNGNKMRIIDIIYILGLSEDDIVSYLEQNFFPGNYKKYPQELWDLYL